MSDHDDPTPGPLHDEARDEAAFDDPAHDELRALLADVRATEPVPADVTARLDATLAALREERLAEAGVVPLRRRRAVGRFLVAAAAVVVVGAGGVGIAQLGQNGSGDNAASADKASSGSAETGTISPTAPKELGGSTSPAPAGTPAASALKDLALPKFTTARFAEQAASFDPTDAHLTRDEIANQYDSRTPASDAPTTTSEARGDEACPGPTIADTTSYAILLDGHLAVLVLHQVVDGTQGVDAWSCDGKTELTTTTVTR